LEKGPLYEKIKRQWVVVESGEPDDVRLRDWGFFLSGFIGALVLAVVVFVSPNDDPIIVPATDSTGIYIPCESGFYDICLRRYLDIGH